MNKFKLVLFSILGGIEVVFYIFTPIAITTLWFVVFGIENWTSKLFLSICLLSAIFRAIKIGFMNS